MPRASLAAECPPIYVIKAPSICVKTLTGETLSVSGTTAAPDLSVTGADFTITDDDDAPSGPIAQALLSAADVSIPEGHIGIADMTFTVTLSPAAQMASTVDWSTTTGPADNATAGIDYTAASGTLNFARGETSKTVTIKIICDEVDESDESLTVNFSNASHGMRISDDTAIGMIVDDDTMGLVFDPEEVTVSEAAGATRTATYTVALASQPTAAVSVAVASADVSAASVNPATLSFSTSNWKTGQTVTVTGVDDGIDSATHRVTEIRHTASGGDYALVFGTVPVTVTDAVHAPTAWLARFGRTVTDQVVDAVTARLSAQRALGAEATLAGQALPRWTPGAGDGAPNYAAVLADADRHEAAAALRHWTAFAASDPGESAAGHGFPRIGGDAPAPELNAVTPHDFLAGTSFALTAEAGLGGLASMWGRGAVTSFDGRDGDVALDGIVTTAFLGADWSPDPASGAGRRTAGLAIGRSVGTGEYRSGSGGGDVEAHLTGLYPYAGAELDGQLSVWAVAGYGTGEVSVTPEGGSPRGADLSMRMGAAGLQSGWTVPAEGGALALAIKGDTRLMQIESRQRGGLTVSEASTWLARVGIEASRSFALSEGGASLTPSFEVGLRRGGGDAETGIGADIGVGIAFADPETGLGLDVNARGLVTHRAPGFREWGASASLVWDPRPESNLGRSLTLTRSLGVSPSGGMDALLSRETLAVLANDDDGLEFEAAGRFEGEFGYGMPMFGGSFIGTPNMGFAHSDEGTQDWRVGWRLTREALDATEFDVSLDVTRRESASDDAAGTEPAHGLILKGTIRW